MKLSTDLGPHEKEFKLPLGLNGYVTIRRRKHPLAKGRAFEAAKNANTRRYLKEYELARKRIQENDPGINQKIITNYYAAIFDEAFGAYTDARNDETEALRESIELAASFVIGFRGPVFGDTEFSPEAVKDAFFGPGEAAQVVPRFELADGSPLLDRGTIREAHGIVSACEKDLESRRGNVDPDDAGGFEKFREKRIGQMEAALSKLKVRLSPHGGKRLDAAMVDIIVGFADEVEKEFQENLGFLSES